jgi:integrase
LNVARQVERLTVRQVQTAKAGYHADGGGLYLQVTATGAKSWIYRYRSPGGQRHELGLGPLRLVGLAEARAKAVEHGRARLAGIDPLTEKRSLRAAQRVSEAKLITFKECAERHLDAHSAGWRGGNQLAQWQQSLTAYVYPVLGALPVASIDVGLVMRVLEPIWQDKTTTASRVRQRVEAILDWATARGYRQGDNPARWRGHLEKLLPMPRKVAPIEHHPALPYAEMAGFMVELRAQTGIAARALEFSILTAARSGEVLGARWDEINLAERVWIVPASRMKAGKEHKVPLSDAALAIVAKMAELRTGEGVFPGRNRSSPLSRTTVFNLLRVMNRGDLTTHGFRSSFRDWAAERTNFPREVAEIALAHAVGSEVERAYQRSDLFAKRRQLMQAWSKFCAAPATASGEKVMHLLREA